MAHGIISIALNRESGFSPHFVAGIAALLALLVLVTACGATTTSRSETPSPSQSPAPLVTIPPPSAHPAYPPHTLADLAALGRQGLHRQFAGAEAGDIDGCSVVWVRVREVATVTPRQAAADLVEMALAKNVFYSACGGYVYGTTNLVYCNCYHGDHGVLTVTRGQHGGMGTGKMSVNFSANDNYPTRWDWTVVLPAPGTSG